MRMHVVVVLVVVFIQYSIASGFFYVFFFSSHKHPHGWCRKLTGRSFYCECVCLYGLCVEFTGVPDPAEADPTAELQRAAADQSPSQRREGMRMRMRVTDFYGYL